MDAATAAAVGNVLGRLHSTSAGRAEIARAFDTIANFYALRLEPYLVATANRHPALAPALLELVALTAGTQTGRLEARAARLLPALLLARVVGKSPVEYITEDAERSFARSVAGALLHDPQAQLGAVKGLPLVRACAEHAGLTVAMRSTVALGPACRPPGFMSSYCSTACSRFSPTQLLGGIPRPRAATTR